MDTWLTFTKEVRTQMDCRLEKPVCDKNIPRTNLDLYLTSCDQIQ